jgi:hypothetical protein
MKTITSKTVLASALIAVLLTSCGDNGIHRETSKTVVIDGKSQTCEELLKTETGRYCQDGTAKVWARWGDNFPKYLKSDKLVPLPQDQKALLGVVACSTMDEEGKTSKDFVSFAHVLHPNNSEADMHQYWTESQRLICPDLPAKE